MTGADLPNAFPYFSTITAVLVLVAYAVLYCLPCLVLLAVGLTHGKRVTAALRRLHDRYGTDATIPANPKQAVALLIAALVVAAIAVQA